MKAEFSFFSYSELFMSMIQFFIPQPTASPRLRLSADSGQMEDRSMHLILNAAAKALREPKEL
jgi:hypothetical protein